MQRYEVGGRQEVKVDDACVLAVGRVGRVGRTSMFEIPPTLA